MEQPKALDLRKPASTLAPALDVHHETYKSLLMTILHAAIRPFRPRLANSHVAPQPAGSARLTAPKQIYKKCRVQERQVDGIWVYDVSKDVPEQSEKVKRIYYFAGGGWQMIPGTEHWNLVGELAQRVQGVVVTLVSYPLAPNYPAHVAMPLLKILYHTLIRQSRKNGEKVIFAGDSSGGNVVLSLVLWLVSEAEKKGTEVLAPDEMLVISPSTDLRHEEPLIAEAAKWDPIMTPEFIDSTADGWTGVNSPASEEERWKKDDPRVSPTLADLSVFARHGIRINGITGSWDVLSPEAVIFREKIRDEGAEGSWIEWEKQMHCFPLAARYGLRECKKAMAWIVETMEKA